MKALAPLALFALLAACGADGPPVAPSLAAQQAQTEGM